MTFLTAWHTDTGIRKEINQDSLLIEQAYSAGGDILLAAVCDGMGGLSRGEVASGSMVHVLSEWFKVKFPLLAFKKNAERILKKSMEELAVNVSRKMTEYGCRHGIRLGTTCAALLIFEGRYYILNAGDSRVYLRSDSLYQLTRDQTFVQREKELGRMSAIEAERDSRKNILLECIGGEEDVHPDFFTGKVSPGLVFLICSDGFSHKLAPYEIFDALDPVKLNNSNSMKRVLIGLTELCKVRSEQDNITSVLIRTGE